MSIDLDKRVADLRQAPRWPADERAAILDQILATEPAPHRTDLRLISSRSPRRRQGVTIAAAAGLAAAAAIVVPAVLPTASPGSANHAAARTALHHLSHLAAVAPVDPADHARPDQYVHVVRVEDQTALAGQAAVASRFEYWVGADGRTWQLSEIRVGHAAPRTSVELLPPGGNYPDFPTRQYLRRLPTEPAALDSYLRTHTTGSTSPDERVFVALSSLISRGLATPELRAAAIEVLARLGHVQLGDRTRDSQGNLVQEFKFVDQHGRPNDVQTLMFDTRTAQIVEQRDYFNGKLHFRASVEVFNVVDTVPSNIRERAVLEK